MGFTGLLARKMISGLLWYVDKPGIGQKTDFGLRPSKLFFYFGGVNDYECVCVRGWRALYHSVLHDYSRSLGRGFAYHIIRLCL